MRQIKIRRSILIGILWGLGSGLLPAWPKNGPDPGNSFGPIKQGYCVVTPTSVAATGLVVFETFGQFRGIDVTQAGVLSSDMTTHAVLFASTSGRLSRNLGVAIANPSSSPANITLTLRDGAGMSVASTSFALAAHQQTARFVTQLFVSLSLVPRDLTGTLDVSSDVAVAIVGLRFRGFNFSTLPSTSLSGSSPVPVISAGIGGSTAIILAHFATGGGWASEIVLANTSSTDITVRVDLFGTDGLPLTATLNGQSSSSFQNITIRAGGVMVLAPLNGQGDDGF
jgi:hypothetical protein